MPRPPQLKLDRTCFICVCDLNHGPDLTLEQFLKIVEECCLHMVNAVKLRLFMMADGELQDMEYFFTILPNAFSDSDAFKTSVVGLLMRQMLLAYNKLSFSQVYKLYKSLQQYCRRSNQRELSALPAEDMELTSNEDPSTDHIDKVELDTPSLHQSELRSDETQGPLSQKQAEYFLARQVYLLKNNENKAMSPAKLQDELNNILKFNPDFAEAHYLSYLNSVRVQDIYISTHSLLHYFDRLILSGGEGKSNGDEGYGHSLRYAVLNLATLHCRFGHYQQADFALLEAIRIAQEANDHVCLQHCLLQPGLEPNQTFLQKPVKGCQTPSKLTERKSKNTTLLSTSGMNTFARHCNSSVCLCGRVMLASAELHWDSSDFASALPLLLQALALSRQHNLQSLTSETLLHLAFTQLMLGIPEQALVLVQDVLESVLAHGSLIDKGRALLLAARCQMALAGAAAQEHRLTAFELAVHTLDEAAVYFSQLDCKERMRDIHYLQARLHHTLGNISQRNKCAMLFRLLDQELPSSGMTVVNRL
ncbi:anaphase-promoting complex subunit 5-like [Garra rufa]|uniref:anaphase-promoting complex subunit 5-like n=1 Tax=Garra rufa TaxID=137080 RepID=UPI003CCEC433